MRRSELGGRWIDGIFFLGSYEEYEDNGMGFLNTQLSISSFMLFMCVEKKAFTNGVVIISLDTINI